MPSVTVPYVGRRVLLTTFRVGCVPQEQEQGIEGGHQHGETDEFYQSAPASGPTSHVQQPIRRRGGISAEHVSEEEATSYVKKVNVTGERIIVSPVTYIIAV